MRTMLTDNLEFDGYRVTAVESGEEALDELARMQFSLLLSTSCSRASTVSRCAAGCGPRHAGTVIMLTARTQEPIGSAGSTSAPTTTSASRSA